MLPTAVKENSEKASRDEGEKKPPSLEEGEPSRSEGGTSFEQLKEEVEALREELKEERTRAEKYLTQLKYLRSDYENLRRRQAREVEAAIAFGNERLMTNLLGVLDELEMAVRAGRRGEKREKKEGDDPLLEGVEMTLKRLYETLSREGLSRIEALGKPFNPELHEAFERVFTKDCPEGTVVEEIRSGFTYKGKVIRPSVVKVAVSSQGPSCEGKPEGGRLP